MSEQSINQIIQICKDLDIPEKKIESIENMVRLAIPSELAIPPLPDDCRTYFDAFDYLVAPLKSNSRVHIYGRPGSGKTSIIVAILKSLTSKYDANILWLDSSFKVNKKFFKKFDLEEDLLFFQTSTIDKEKIQLLTEGVFNVLVLDDVASFQQSSTEELERLLYICKVKNILVLIANQIREMKGRVYAPKQELQANYDMSLSIKKYSVNMDKKFNDFNIKLEYAKNQGKMVGKSIIVPVGTDGFIKEDLLNKRIERLSAAEDFESFENLIKHRELTI